MWERRQLCGTGRQPADWRSGAGYLPQHGVPLRALIGPICGAILLVVVPGWWPGAHFNQRMVPPLVNVRGALPYLLYACDRDGRSLSQTLLLGVAIFPT